MHILIIDDHTLLREALTLLLKEFDPTAIIIAATTCEQAEGALNHYSNLDLILLAPALAEKECLSFLPRLRARAPDTPTVILSSTDDTDLMHKLLSAGANAVIPKSTHLQEMKDALRLVLDGEIYIPPALLTAPELPSLCNKPPEPAEEIVLTPRQLEVLDLMALGLPNKLIARELDLTEGTVKLHVSAILRGLETRNRTEAVREAARLGIIGGGGSLH